MEPRIQYAKTEDGVNIAYWTIGEGDPLVVFAPLVFSHLQFEWQIPELRAWYERLARSGTVVRWDYRGMGLSDRTATEFTEQGYVRDLEAVVDRLGLDTFAILCLWANTTIAVNYAAQNPHRVSHLVAWQPLSIVNEPPAPDELIERDWELWTEGFAHRVLGWASGRQAHEWAQFLRQSVTKETYTLMRAQAEIRDVTARLPDVQAPTLVLSHPGALATPAPNPREFASRIPDARIVFLDGGGRSLWENEDAFTALHEFIHEGEPPSALGSLREPDTALILFLDIADSTALTTKLGDAAYRERERNLDGQLRRAIRDAGGSPVEGKVLGDGIMAVFSSASQAIDAAHRCRDAGTHAGLPLHVGIHAGDVVREGNNVHGGAVQVAARVQSVAEPGEILVSATVRDLARTSAGVAFIDRGEHDLKGIDEPVRLWAVRWD